MKLTIKRKEWLRGEGTERSYLVRKSDNRKCCLGILGIACGLSPDMLRGLVTPSDFAAAHRDIALPPHYQWTVARGVFMSSDAAQEAMRINDAKIGDTTFSHGLVSQVIASEEEREQLIAEIFKVHDIDVQFED